jgi:hypothetical protein
MQIYREIEQKSYKKWSCLTAFTPLVKDYDCSLSILVKRDYSDKFKLRHDVT